MENLSSSTKSESNDHEGNTNTLDILSTKIILKDSSETKINNEINSELQESNLDKDSNNKDENQNNLDLESNIVSNENKEKQNNLDLESNIASNENNNTSQNQLTISEETSSNISLKNEIDEITDSTKISSEFIESTIIQENKLENDIKIYNEYDCKESDTQIHLAQVGIMHHEALDSQNIDLSIGAKSSDLTPSIGQQSNDEMDENENQKCINIAESVKEQIVSRVIDQAMNQIKLSEKRSIDIKNEKKNISKEDTVDSIKKISNVFSMKPKKNNEKPYSTWFSTLYTQVQKKIFQKEESKFPIPSLDSIAPTKEKALIPTDIQESNKQLEHNNPSPSLSVPDNDNEIDIDRKPSVETSSEYSNENPNWINRWLKWADKGSNPPEAQIPVAKKYSNETEEKAEFNSFIPSDSIDDSKNSGFWSSMKSNYDFFLTDLKLKYEETISDFDNRVKSRIWSIMEDKLDIVLEEQMKPWLHEYFQDKNMPEGLCNVISLTIDSLWPDFREEFWDLYYTRKEKSLSAYKEDKLLNKKYVENIDNTVETSSGTLLKSHNRLNFLSISPYQSLRGFILYHVYPYNLSLWDRTNDIWWWIFKLIRMCPIYGISSWSFLILYALIDRTDEFQLVQFILDVKGAQFVTVGVTSSLIAMIKYWRCVNWTGGETHTCSFQGPGSEDLFYFGIIGFLLDLVLAWMAFARLPYSERKGEFVFEHVDRAHGREFVSSNNIDTSDYLTENLDGGWLLVDRVSDDVECITAEERDRSLSFWRRFFCFQSSTSRQYIARRGGHLPALLQYDLIAFFCVIFLLFLLLFLRPYGIFASEFLFSMNEWMFKADLFFLKTFFGLLSFPFVIFISPMSGILTHIKKTGYNKIGECIPRIQTKGQWGLG